MSVSSSGNVSELAPPPFEIKSAQLSAISLVVKQIGWPLLLAELLRQYGPDSENSDFFDNDPLVIDLSQVEADAPVQDLKALVDVLYQCRLHPVGVRSAQGDWLQKALDLGLLEISAEVTRPKVSSAKELPAVVVQEVIKEVVREVSGPATMVIDKPLRSGQKIYARGADLVVLAMVNQGAEVAADGNIHVYAPLRGKAMAGARGNVNARIFSLCMEPELISIAGVYRTSENALPAEIHGKAAQIRLSNDGQEKLIFEALKN
jgi:septum site-determining protein MinC